jgi:hypothetical protein
MVRFINVKTAISVVTSVQEMPFFVMTAQMDIFSQAIMMILVINHVLATNLAIEILLGANLAHLLVGLAVCLF